MRIMSKDTIALKERIIALVDGCNLPYVIPMLCDLENTIHEHSFDNGGSYFDIWCDDYYVIMNKGGDSFDDVLEIPLIGERKTTSGLENCSIWWG